ncbi:Protein smg5 [Homalodisca vitripennis]|nr:Protein smg5 [Homalodisca vitripennis]
MLVTLLPSPTRLGPLWKPLEVSYLRSHLQAGIGHYHHLLLRLQIDFRMDLRGIVDFPYLVADIGLKKGKSSSTSKEKPLDSGAVDWANLAVHRCLIYLGDLGRYLADLCPGYHTDLPARYYHQDGVDLTLLGAESCCQHHLHLNQDIIIISTFKILNVFILQNNCITVNVIS